MRNKPILFHFLFFFFLGICLSLPFQIAYLYEHDLTRWYDWQSLFMKITPLNWMVMFATGLNAYLSFKAHSAIKWTVPISIFIVATNNFFVGSWGTDFSIQATWLATIGYAMLGYVMVYGFGLDALNHPENHWWKIPPRHQKSMPVWIEWQGNKKLLKTFDLSKTGAFLSALSKEQFPKDISIGDSLNIVIGTSHGDLRMSATLVRKEQESRGNYPAGLGINFQSLSLKDNLLLHKIIRMPEAQI
ncbi:MAG: hypothetical protein NXH75_13845 [Halobacteriovoraceae bacterium]|nr:hypothetical protein [Halobacteriovoraceae bacterium]